MAMIVYYYTLHIFYCIKVIRQFPDYVDNPVNNIIINIYNVKGDKRLSPGLHPLTTGSVFKVRFSVRFRNCFYYAGNYFVVF